MNENNLNQNVVVQQKPISAMAVTSLVLGCIGLITSAIPIINNAAFLFGALGIIFGIIGAVGIFKGKKRPKPLIIVALIINVLAIIVVLATQNLYGQAINDATKGATASYTSSQDNNYDSSKNSNSNSNNKDDNKDNSKDVTKIGNSITLSNNLELTVISAEGGLVNYDGSPVTKVTVKYVNKGNKEVSYNTFDWKAENSQGAQTNSTIYSNGNLTDNANNLQSGKLSAGGTTTGVIYFKGDVNKVLYSSTILSGTTATWIK